MVTLPEAARYIEQFEKGSLKSRIASLEKDFQDADHNTCVTLCQSYIEPELLTSALTLKRVAGQVNVIIHAVGILLSLPYILQEGEVVLALSLGAGNTGKPFDLETNRRVAEFKFIHWKGGPESIRQNQLFKDFYYLAEVETSKERYLYVLGEDYPLRFLKGGRRLSSVTSRNKRLEEDFKSQYGERFEKVSDYYAYRETQVRIVDLSKIVPHFASGFSLEEPEEAEDAENL